MGIITDIKAQKRNKNRVSVYVDGKFLTGMQSIVAAKQGLKPGIDVDERFILSLIVESEAQEAFEKALSYISKGPHTCMEVRRNLRAKEYLDDVIDVVIEKLKSYGYLDDDRYAESFVNFYGKEKGINQLAASLSAKGVDKSIVEEKLATVGDQHEAAETAVKKYLRTHHNADKNKLRRYLYSKGFTYSTISDVMGSGDDD